MELVVIGCPICESADVRPYAARFRVGAPHFLRVQCKHCGLIFADPQASKRELEIFYQNYYDKGNFEGWKDEVRAWRKQFDSTHKLTREIGRLMRHVQNPQGKRWLEVGAGLGKAAYEARSLGFEVTATEFDTDAKTFLQDEMGIQDVRIGDILDLNLPANSYDVVVIHHVLEHVGDAVATMREIQRVLAPGGIVFIGVPNLSSRGYKMLRTASFLRFRIPDIVDGIEHTFGFTPRTLTLCCEKAGLQVKSIRTFGLEKKLGLRARKKDRIENFFHVKQECVAQKVPVAQPATLPRYPAAEAVTSQAESR